MVLCEHLIVVVSSLMLSTPIPLSITERPELIIVVMMLTTGSPIGPNCDSEYYNTD